MWEVYYPNLGWMCVDATDPAKGSWLRYVNWARSGKEQNLFPLEINRTIYYKTLKPIEPGDELLVWYNGEEDPGIAAALEEERASHRGRRSSPKAKRGKKKSQEAKSKGKKARDKKRKAPLGLDLTPFDMRETKEGHKPEEEAPAVSAVLPLDQAAVIQEMVNHNALPHLLVSSPASEPPASPEDKPEGLVCGPKDRGEDLEEEEEEEEAEEEEEELVEEMEEEEEEEPEEEEEGSLSKEIPEVESTSAGEDKLESAEEQSSLSEDSPGSSPKKKPSVKFPKARGESNGGVPGASMFPCQHCERKFTTKQGLERHVHIHISAISHAFKCRYCGKAFGTQINRRRHERRHEAGPKRKLLLPSASAQPSGGSAQAAEGGAQSDAKVRQEAPEAEKAPSKTPHPPSSEESREPKESHPCQYCRKVFGTHTNMRRHQRRVHERHLIPKGVRRKPEEPQAPAGQAQHPSSAYVASTDLEEEGEADDTYAMGVSSNITENLNYYIDGKIQSSSSTSNCDMIEVESGSAEVFGINCLLSPVAVEISPNVKAVPVRLVEGSKEPPGGGHPEAKRRRTASPPLLAKIKTETEAEPIASLCSLTIPLAISTVESLPFPKEKSIYLSSKLKQLLQTQDNNKAAPSPPSSSSGDVPKLGLPAASSPLLPATSSRFKRRTSSPQHSPGLRDPGKASEGQPAWSEAALGSKLPKLERRSNSPAWSSSGREDREATSPLRSEERPASKEWTPSPPFGNVCNQQPLDLSSSVKQRSNGKGSAQGPWESVLDLSVHKKPGGDGEGKEAPSTPPAGGAVRKKPTTSMLQKVLLNEYNGTSLAPESLSPDTGPGPKACKLPEAPSLPGSAPPAPAVELGCPGLATETPLPPAPACQAPSVLARTASPSHPPCPPMLKVPTPPPPLLPTVGSPLPEDPVSTPPSPCPSPLSNATAPSPLPILSPTVSASPVRSVEPLGCASPGPPTLSPSSSSSSSSSSSFSSSSSSTSPSSSPSPPPLSLVSSVLSPGENLENSAPLVAFKQEEDEHRCQKPREDPHRSSAADALQEPFSKRFVCNVCEAPFLAIKDLTKHLCVHAGEWPFKCEFCVQLFREKAGLSEHRFLLHGVGNIFVCSVCKKEFAFLCNLQQHQRDLHPDKECTHHQFESGILRPQNFTDPSKANAEQMQSLPHVALESSKEEEGGEEGEEGEEGGPNDSSEELYTTIKIMAAGVKPKDPDVRMGLNQHYPSFKPPPFQYHHRNPNGIGATATNFTTHNIPQTFSTAIRCTKCGKSVDNMPELHKHILACASASDKKRYTPKKNPVPLKQVVHPKNGVVLPGPANHSFRRVGQPKRLDFGVEVSRTASDKLKLSALKKKNQLVQKAILQKKRSQQRAELRNSSVAPSAHICPYCGREFTYIGSLNKHASYSCPQKPLSSSSKKKAKKKSGASPPGSNKSGANPRRRTADAEIKMQGAHAHLGKTRARSSGPAAAQPPPAPLKLKQSVKFVHPVKSKKPPPLPAARNVGPARGGKAVPPEGKRSQGVPKGGPPGLLSKASRKLHVRIRRSQAALASKKKADRFGARSSRERVGGPVTRSLQHATFAEAAESKREESLARPELKDFRNLL